MNYLELNRAGSNDTIRPGSRYCLDVSLRVVNYVLFGQRQCRGAWMVLHRPRGVSRITRVGVDKVGFNRLLVPYQHPLPSTNHLSSPLTIAMPRVNNTYVVPFKPVRNGPGEFAYAKECFNVQ